MDPGCTSNLDPDQSWGLFVLVLFTGVLFVAPPTEACLLTSSADDLFALPAAPTLPLPALPGKPGNDTTTNIPPWAGVPHAWDAAPHREGPAGPGLAPAESNEAAPAAHVTARAGNAFDDVGPTPPDSRNTSSSAESAPVQAPSADQAAMKQDTPPSSTPPSASEAAAAANQTTSSRPGRTPSRFRTPPTPQPSTQETPRSGGRHATRGVRHSATRQPAPSEATAAADSTGAGSSGQRRMLPGGGRSGGKRGALVTISGAVPQNRGPVPAPAPGVVRAPPQSRTAATRHPGGPGTGIQHSADLANDGKHLLSGSDVVDVSDSGSKGESAVSTAAAVRRELPGGGRSGGKHLLSGSDVVDVSDSGSKNETADSAAAAVRRELPGGGRSGGKHLLSGSDISAAGNSTNSTGAVAGGTNGTGVGRAQEAAEAATGLRLLSGGGRGNRRMSGVQPGAQAGAPPVARTAPGHPSNAATKVQPMAVRLGGHLGPKLPRSDCSWWDRFLAVLDALLAGTRQQKRC